MKLILSLVNLITTLADKKSADPSFSLRYIESSERLVHDAEVGASGFEGGRTVGPIDGHYYVFTAEFRGQPIDSNMRTVVLKTKQSNDPFGGFEVATVIARTDPRQLKVTAYNQSCAYGYCPEKNLDRPEVTRMGFEYTCGDTTRKDFSPWMPVPVFSEAENVWKVYSVVYACDFREQVLCGEGNIFLYTSKTKGYAEGVAGPYESRGIVLGPSAAAEDVARRNATQWGSVSHTAPDFMDEFAVFRRDSEQDGGPKYAAFAGEDHFLATSDDLSGDFNITNISLKDAIGIETYSPYAENPITTRLEHKDSTTGKVTPVYAAVFDAVFYEHFGLGVSFSPDGLGAWTKGAMVPVERGCRTPLGLVPWTSEELESNVYLLYFTRRHPECNSDTEGGNRGTAQQDNCGGFGASYPSMCAPLYAAKVELVMEAGAEAEELSI